ncbi:hypothetical protein [Legionella brunensis]|uniref:Uncharacterized protein n=1 Tax=Legionella brunensis TaxID=29422 RepID=A0A0W0ST13_9GAMM|nr:hypothetical protein [Legionella brunensis]KTC86345.1 hypothetical protein Lbru_0839 [Legionella brunensis]
MTDIFEKIKEFQQALIKINNKTPSPKDSAVLDNKELARTFFVDPSLLPKSPDSYGLRIALSEEKSVSITEFVEDNKKKLEEYSFNALQAALIITQSAADGYALAMKNGGTITRALNFLDSREWVPKIVDQRTYEVGKALQKFLNDALSPEVMENIYESFLLVPIREPAKQQMLDMLKVLNPRLEAYEMHSPEKVAEVKAFFSFVKERENTIWKKEKEFEKKEREIGDYVLSIEGRLKKPPVSSQELKEIIESLPQKLHELREARRVFVEQTEQWQAENQGEFEINGIKQSLPASIKVSSPLFSRLGKNKLVSDDEVIDEWVQVFNDPEQVKYSEEPIKTSLDKTYQKMKDASNSQRLEEYLQKQKAIAEEQFFAQTVPTFLAQLQGAIAAGFAVAIPPASYQPGQIPNDADACEKTLREVKAYLEEFEEKAGVTYRDFEVNNPCPEELSTLDRKSYGRALKEAKGQLLSIQEQHIGEIKNYIISLQEKLNTLSAKVRSEKLREMGRDIGELYKSTKAASAKEIQAKVGLERFTHDQYWPARDEIEKRYEPQFNEIEKKFDTRAEERRVFLREAQEALLQYKKALTESTDIYIPEKQVPQEELKKYLEIGGNPKESEWIDGLYKQIKDASGWRGFWTNVSNYASHYNPLGASGFDLDNYYLIQDINKKLEQIEAELVVNIREKDVLPTHQNMADNNLYALQQQYHQSPEIKQLEEAKAKEIAAWNEKRKPYVQDHLQAQLSNQLVTVVHEQAIIQERIFRLDCGLSDLQDSANHLLDEVTRSLVTMNGAQALEYWEHVKNEVAAIDIHGAFSTAKSYKEPSGVTVSKEIDGSLKYKEKEWGEEGSIKETKMELIEIPVELEKLETDARMRFQVLKQQKIKLDQKPNAIVGQIEARKAVIASLIELAEIQQELSDLLKRRETATDDKAKETLLIDISKMEAKVKVSIRSFEGNNDSDVKQKLTTTNKMLRELAEVKTKLQIELLTGIDSEIMSLNEKTGDFLSVGSEARKIVAQSIAQFEEKITAIIEDCSQSEVEEVRTKLAVTQSQMVELHARRTIVPILNRLDTIHTGYSDLANEVRSLSDTKFIPSFALLVKAKELDKQLSALDTVDNHPLVSKKLAFIEEVKAKISPVKEKCAEAWSNNPLDVLTEIHEAYQALNEKRKVLEPQYKHGEEDNKPRSMLPRYYQKDKRQLYKEIAFLDSVFTEVTRISNQILGEAEQEKLALIKKEQTKMFLFQQVNAPQSEDAKKLFGDENSEEQYKEQYNEARVCLEKEYFGEQASDETSLGGFFGEYLQERAQTFWFRDLMSSVAAFALGCFGYKTEAQERQEYLQDLKDTFEAYKEDPENYDQLMIKIDEGERFKPRSKEKAHFEHTLQSHLAKFKEEVGKIHEQNTDLEEEETLKACL